MDFTTVNLLGVLVAAIAAFVVGSIYYPLMSKPWLKASRRDPSTIKMSYSPFVISFIGELVMAFAFAALLGAITFGDPGEYTILNGLMWGAMLWLGFVMIAEGQGGRPDDLPGLVTLAGDQQNVAGRQLRDRFADRGAPVADLPDIRRA